eukprot:m.157268 g.157268  ORF g.157268 m.157268 type:complete len:799 (+) comp31047_c0_seq1:151-2547(+)
MHRVAIGVYAGGRAYAYVDESTSDFRKQIDRPFDLRIHKRDFYVWNFFFKHILNTNQLRTMIRCLLLTLFAFGAAVGSASRAPVRDRVDFPGATHLDAFGVSVNTLTSSRSLLGASLIESPKSVIIQDSLVNAISIGATINRQHEQSGLICNSTLINFAACHVVCHFCENIVEKHVNASCVSDGKTGVGETFTLNITIALVHALQNLTLQLGDNVTHLDCTCTGTGVTLSEGCDIYASNCAYLLPGSDDITALLRSKVVDLTNPSVMGDSLGWSDPTQGYELDNQYTAVRDATNSLRNTSAYSSKCPRPTNPLVVIPGLTSSAIYVKFENSKPPAYAFFCNKTSDGWQPIWPIPQDLTSHPAQFVCWSVNSQFTFDNATQTIKPLRAGGQSKVIDFGGFEGIPGFGNEGPVYEIAGWELGKTLFAAPFDWRLPSIAQQSFFSDLKLLVERASATNNGQKVTLWAYSYGPQYTLSFLHRMTQQWKDQYIHWFVGSSPVFGGSPDSLIAYAGGIVLGPPPPNIPKQCKAFVIYAGTCYTGAVTESNTTAAECCEKATTASSEQLFNYFPDNTTCQIPEAYVATYTCSGFLGYIQPNTTGDVETARVKPSSPLAINPTLMLTRSLARASPSMMWTFPKTGTNESTTWTRNDVILHTPTKNYTAFDIDQVLRDLGIGIEEQDLHHTLSTEPDLALFEPPGVNTVITYGYGIPTVSAVHYADDFSKHANPGLPTKTEYADGDGIVELRSSVRGEEWRGDLGTSKLIYNGYANQTHAACFGLPTSTGNASTQCYRDVLNIIARP